MKHFSAQKRRLSLAAQVNILIVVITLSVSLLVVAINTINYRRAILEPSERMLSELEVEEDVLTPYLKYFVQFLGTEEMREVRASLNTPDDHFVDWQDQTPSFTAGDPEYGRESLFFDLTAFDMTVQEIMEPIDLDIACAEILKDGTVYRVSFNEKKTAVSACITNLALKKAFSSSRRQISCPPLS